MKKRVAIAGLYHESNTFVPQPTTLTNFKKGRYLKGQDIVNEYKDAHHEIGGMIEILQQEDIEIIPLLYAEATPGGTITTETYESLLEDLLEEMDKVLPVDALLVAPHGAGVSENFPDMDGHWLSRLRDKLGPGIPVAGTLDLHANVSPLMVACTDALVSYKQNPHVDQRERGKEAARLLMRQLRKEIGLVQVLIQVPVAISIEQQLTADEPCKSLYQYAQSLSEQEGMLSLSIQLGFPYADVAEMGISIIVVSDNRRDMALATGEKLKDYIIAHKENFVGKKIDIPSALLLVKESKKPALLLDMGDNIGGGSPGNNICLLEALQQQKEYAYFVCIYDPQAVADAEKHNEGETFILSIDGINGNGNKSFPVEVTLLGINDGNFKESRPRHGGQVNYKMGKTAIVAPRAGSVIMLTSLRTPPFSLQQLLSFGIDPGLFDAIVAKGVNAPVAAYAPVCPAIIQVDTPGVTQADMTKFTFHNRRRPLFPFEEIL